MSQSSTRTAPSGVQAMTLSASAAREPTAGPPSVPSTRPPSPPSDPSQVLLPHPGLRKIVKVVCGGNHTIAIDETGHAFGWGNNSHLQLSHSDSYHRFTNPLMASFDPIPLSRGTLLLTQASKPTELSTQLPAETSLSS